MSKGARARKRDRMQGGGGDAPKKVDAPAQEEESSGGGFLIGLRGGIKSVAGEGKKDKKPSTLGKVFDWLLWAAVAAAVVLFVLGRFRGR